MEIVKALLCEQGQPVTTGVPFSVGQSYFLRTVTYHIVGRVRQIVGHWLVLDDAAWVADTERFADAMAKGQLKEVEPLPQGWVVNLDTVTDAGPWIHGLPLSQK